MADQPSDDAFLPLVVQDEATRREAVARVMQLMSIPGRSGDEAAIAAFIRSELLAHGAHEADLVTDQAHLHTPLPGNTGNLIFTLSASNTSASQSTINQKRRMLVAHLDTVPICVGSQPTIDSENPQRVYSAHPPAGLGADNRAGCAVTLTAAIEILRHQLPHPPLTFLWTIQEEIGLHGARLLDLDLLQNPSYSFNWDGGAPQKLTIGATGGYRMEITIRGKASHAGNAPADGVSAIVVAAVAIAHLQQNGWHGDIQKGDQRGTSNVGVISGGAATNVVADEVVVRAEARSHDTDFRRQIVEQIEAAFLTASREIVNRHGETASIDFRGNLDYESFALPSDEPTVQLAAAAVEAAGCKPELAIANGGLDANWLSARGIPTVSLGCGQRNQHMVSESLELGEFWTACQIALRIATAQ